MSWVTDLARKAKPPFVINDSKTPSGRAHVGALRGVLIHDSIFRTIRALDESVRYYFGSDDFDALDELPYGLEEYYRPYLGVPLCNVPAPPGSDASDIADFYISDFFDVFRKLGVSAETYRMRDLYRSDRMDEIIRTVLLEHRQIQAIYYRISGSRRPDNWHPLQVICPTCGKVGTTMVTDYDGRRVYYECCPSLVSWATGCGSKGWITPFGGNSKLPWKIEWAARWAVLGVTIEGAGKDHTTRGGSRDIADAVARDVLGINPPLNLPYEFFLVGGSKMSSSKGIGASASEIAHLLPPQVLRFLLVRTPPRRALNFSPDLEFLARLYADYDRMLSDMEEARATALVKELYFLSRVPGSVAETARVGRILPWDTIVSIIQLPHVDFWTQARQRFDPPLSPAEVEQLRQRVESAQTWLQKYASSKERVEVTQNGHVQISLLSNSQRGFLATAASIMEDIPWEPDAVQASLFDGARITPIDPREAFEAIYMTFLGRKSGPRAGNLLAFLDRESVLRTLSHARYSRRELLKQTALPQEQIITRVRDLAAELDRVELTPEVSAIDIDNLAGSEGAAQDSFVDGIGAVNIIVAPMSGKRELLRTVLVTFEGYGSSAEKEEEYFIDIFNEFIDELKAAVGVPIDVKPLVR